MKFTAQIDMFYEKWQHQKSQLNHAIEKDNQDFFRAQLVFLKKIRDEWNEILRQKEKMKYFLFTNNIYLEIGIILFRSFFYVCQ